jgi:glutamate carboxypeptidase
MMAAQPTPSFCDAPRRATAGNFEVDCAAMSTFQARGDDAAKWLGDKQRTMEEAIASLVEVNSFTDNADGGRAVGKMLREQTFAIGGVDAKTTASSRYADHLTLATKGRPGAPPIALVGHLDTVFPPGTFERFRRDGDLARGPGVLDMKGGLVVVASALRALAETCGLDAVPPLRIVVVADEEVGSPEGQAIIRDHIAGSSGCLVFEAGRTNPKDAIITRRKGTGGMTVRVLGKAAHSGNNHKDGVNALWALARFVDRAQALTDYDRGVTVNVGKITGGQGKNTVPDKGEAAIDLRFCTKADGEALVAAIRRVAEEAAQSIPGARVEFEGGVARMPLERTDASVALMNAYGACARASGLGSDEAPLIGGGSDASTSSAMGIASIDGLGPRGVGFHTQDERIEVASLVPKAQALARFLASV